MRKGDDMKVGDVKIVVDEGISGIGSCTEGE